MRRTAILSVALLVAVAGSTAAAQVRMNPSGGSTRPISIAIGGGASVPIGSYKDALKAGWNGQGSLIFNLGGLPLALRADLNYNTFTFKEDLAFTSGTGGTFTTTDDITQQILGGLANITIPFGMGPITPYVTAGLAGFNIKTKLGDAAAGVDDESETKFAVNGGAGLSLRLLGASAFIEAKLNNVYTDKKFISNKELKALQFVPVTFGFVF
jgi:opacity protein-like surface antigen